MKLLMNKMGIENINTDRIKINDLFILSNPLTPDLFKMHEKKFPGIPPFVLNKKNELVSGLDCFSYIKEIRVKNLTVIKTDLNDNEALFLGFNQRSILKEFNMFEKISFIKKIIKYSAVNEIYDRTGINISIDHKLLKNLDLLLKNEFEELLIKNGITVKTALKLCEMKKEDREILIGLFSDIPMSSSRQKNLRDLIEDILFRDKCRVKDVLEKTSLKDGKKDDFNIDIFFRELFRIRYPQYSKYEDLWAVEVKNLSLPPGWKITHSDFFEKEDVELKISKKDLNEIKELLDKVKDR